MKRFKPQSPNPSIKKPADATLAVLGQLNEIVDQKADNLNFSGYVYSDPEFIITPSMIKLGDKVTISNFNNPGDAMKTYSIKGIAHVYSTTNYFNIYLGTIEYIDTECTLLNISKTLGTITANDGNSLIVTPFAVNAIMNDPDVGNYPSLTQAQIEAYFYSYTDNNVTYTGYDLTLHGYAQDASYLQGEIAFEIEVLYNDFCNNKKELAFYFYD